jgi:peroxiredoxin Q/BCP
MVELRKRKTPPPAPVRPAKKASAPKSKKAAKDKTVVEQATEAVTEAAVVVADVVTDAVEAAKEAVADVTNGDSKTAAAGAGASTSGPPKVGDTIDVASFGGEVETHDGQKTTLAKLVEESKGGVVLFTYPKASTPGCSLTRPVPQICC